MKFQNTERAFVPTGPRESVPPYGITRDFTQEEVDKSVDLRHAIECGYLEPYDPKKPVRTSVQASAKAALKPGKKADYIIASDNVGGAVQTKRPASGKPIEYVVADGAGVDGIAIPDDVNEVVAQRVDGKLPVDHIEPALAARDADGNMTTQWTRASDAFERQIADETQDVDYDDSDTLTEGDDSTTNPLPADADEEIAADLATLITKNEGNMGARETNSREMLKEAVAKTLHAVDAATRPNYDDGERVTVVGEDAAANEAADLLSQDFSTKKWFISRSKDATILSKVVELTSSENVKALASQRLSELGS